MWLSINNELDNSKILSTAGKALCMCQKFELTCKDIIMWLSTAKSLHEKEFKFLSEEHHEYSDKLLGGQLNKILGGFRKKFGNDYEEDVKNLHSARESRNFICHDLLKDFISASYVQQSKYTFDKKALTKHLQNIAIGDYIVSRWSYEFHEKESGYFKDKENYVQTLVSWAIDKI